MNRLLPAACSSTASALRCLPVVLLFVCLVALPGAPMPPDELLDRCLVIDRMTVSPVSIDRVTGRLEVMEGGAASPYSLYLPDADNRMLRIGYASGKASVRDYLFVNAHRGYLDRAIGLAADAPARLERPHRASFAVLGYLGERYLCLMEVHGQGDRMGLRSAYVARIPRRMGADMRLYYKQSDAIPPTSAPSSASSPSTTALRRAPAAR